MAKEKKQEDFSKPIKNAVLTTGTFSVWGIGVFGFIICLFFFFRLKDNGTNQAIVWIIIGIALAIICFLITLPNFIPFLKGKKREKLIREGKIKIEQKKTFNRKYDDED